MARDPRARVGGKCDAPNFRAEHVDSTIWEWVKALLIDEKTLDDGLHVYQEQKAIQFAPLRERLSQVEKLLTKHKQQLERLLDLYLSDDLAKEMFTSRKKEIELSITGLENESRDLKSRLDVETLTPERVKDIHDFAARIRKDLEVVEADFSTRGEDRQAMSEE